MSHRKRTKRLLLAIVLLLVAAPCTFALWLYREMRSPASHDKANDYIEIPRRSTPETIATKLLSDGVIRRKWPLLLYIKLTGSAKLIKAGEYRFPSPITPLGVLKKLEEGEQRLSRFTRSEEHTSELQSRSDLVCRLLLEKKKKLITLHSLPGGRPIERDPQRCDQIDSSLTVGERARRYRVPRASPPQAPCDVLACTQRVP